MERTYPLNNEKKTTYYINTHWKKQADFVTSKMEIICENER